MGRTTSHDGRRLVAAAAPPLARPFYPWHAVPLLCADVGRAWIGVSQT